MKKLDNVSAKVLDYIEQFTYYTEEEKKELTTTQQQRKDQNAIKQEFYHIEPNKDPPKYEPRNKIKVKKEIKDLKIGIWGNVVGKSFHHKKIDF